MIASAPRVLTLNVIESCDAACRYCHWWRVKSTPEPIRILQEAVDEAAAMGVVAIRLSGGEPLLRQDLPTLVAHIHDRGLVGMVCTAAKCELQALEALLDAGLDVLSISIDTLQRRAFRRIRGYDIEPVLENLEALAPRRAGAGFEIVLSVVVTGLAIDGLPRLLEYARALDLVVSFTPFQDGTPQRRSPMSALAFGAEDESRLRDAMCLACEAAAAGLRVVNADTFLSGIANFLTTRRLPSGYVCRGGDAAAIRLAGGELKLCHSLQGVVHAEGLGAAWSSSAARDLRGRMERLECPGCWLSCHADTRRPVPHRFGRPEMWEAL